MSFSVSKKRHGLAHIGLVGMMILAFCIPIMPLVSYPVAATDYTYQTMYASAYNSSYYGTYFATGWPPTTYYDPDPPEPMYEVQVQNDSYLEDLYAYSSAILLYIKTNDFTNPLHHLPWYGNTLGGTLMPELPPDNGTVTILSVCIQYLFKNSAAPYGILKYSIDDQATWESLEVYGSSVVQWNVTSMESWSPGLLRSNELWVQYVSTPAPGIHYYMDYLGISVKWSAPYALDGYPGFIPPEEELPEGETDYDTFFVSTNIVGLLGFVGLCGAIAVPALAVYVYRNGDEGRMVTGIKMLAAFMIFLTLFLISINA